MKLGSAIISGEMVRGTVEETLNALLDAEKQIGFAVQVVTNAAKTGRILGPAAMSVRCTRWLGK